jgi:hypothetical protein
VFPFSSRDDGESALFLTGDRRSLGLYFARRHWGSVEVLIREVIGELHGGQSGYDAGSAAATTAPDQIGS